MLGKHTFQSINGNLIKFKFPQNLLTITSLPLQFHYLLVFVVSLGLSPFSDLLGDQCQQVHFTSGSGTQDLYILFSDVDGTLLKMLLTGPFKQIKFKFIRHTIKIQQFVYFSDSYLAKYSPPNPQDGWTPNINPPSCQCAIFEGEIKFLFTSVFMIVRRSMYI